MEEQDLEEWDAEFLDEVIRVEELNPPTQFLPSQQPLPFSPPPPLHLPPHQPLNASVAASHSDLFLSYSPPRELSQRTAACSNAVLDRASEDDAVAKDVEIERLKKELNRVSKQLTNLEHECSKLKEGKDKDGRTTFLDLENRKQDYNGPALKRPNLKSATPALVNGGVLQEVRCAKDSDGQNFSGVHIAKPSSKAVSVQADLPSHLNISKKLRDIWGSSSNRILGSNLITKLQVACSEDFYVLYGYMSINTSLGVPDSLALSINSDGLMSDLHSSEALEAGKVSHLYTVMTKISNGMADIKALFEPLLDLCSLKNVFIAHRSLRILHALLRHLLGLERKSEVRNNLVDQQLPSKTDTNYCHGARSGELLCSKNEKASFAGPFNLIFESETSQTKDDSFIEDALGLSRISWISLFELMNQIAIRSTDKNVTLEAVSIMNLILLRTNAYVDREKYGSEKVFESISQFFNAGLHVQKEAVRLLYLLLNCPKLLVMFCCGFQENGPIAKEENSVGVKALSMILDGLAGCIASCRGSVGELELCKKVIVVLGFVGSSGKYGFDILVTHKLPELTYQKIKLPNEANFLMLILETLVSEIDRESETESADIFKARTLFMREALMLLNRLVSSPSSSSSVLRALTKSRNMASLTVDVANRLFRKATTLHLSDSKTRQTRESEVVDLARVFKKRIFAFLGD